MRRILDIVIPALLTLLLTWVFVLVPVSVSLFNRSQSIREQYSLIDAFSIIRNSKGAMVAGNIDDSNITVVDLSEIYKRGEIADVMEIVLAARPRVVGFDIALFSRKDSVADLRLEEILKSNPKVVLPCQLEDEAGPYSRSFLNVTRQFFLEGEPFPAANEAAANVDREGVTKVARSFTPTLYEKDTMIESFPVKILSMVDPQKYARFKKRKDRTEYINFKRASFMTVSARPSVLMDNLDLLTDHVVLVGDISDESDKFNTPVDYRMPGVFLHAVTLDTIMNRKPVRPVPDIVSWLLAFIIVALMIPLMRLISSKTSWSVVINPAIQTAVIFLFFFVSYWIFAWFSCYIKPVQILIAIGFAGVADSLYFKIISMIRNK